VDQDAIGWVALAIAAFVYFDLLFVELRRIAREGLRIVKRVTAYGELPVIAQAGRAGDDVARLTLALERLTPLLDRAQTALAAIRNPGRARRGGYAPLFPNGSEASNGSSAD
jgi:hypothetical protein